MSQRVSYADACRVAATLLTNADVWANPDLETAAALRELAAGLEKLARALPPMPSGVRLTEAGAREFITPEAAMRFAAFCAAGFDPEGGK